MSQNIDIQFANCEDLDEMPYHGSSGSTLFDFASPQIAIKMHKEMHK